LRGCHTLYNQLITGIKVEPWTTPQTFFLIAERKTCSG
jgi:hypothetical protein